jgi:uncharacterized protein YsxB (DUF464 family)
MIQVIYHPEYHRITVSGHAYSNEVGKDLVCAAASALAITAKANVECLVELGYARDPGIQIKEGYAEISCTPLRKMKSVVGTVMRTIANGYTALQAEFPDYISYEELT